MDIKRFSDVLRNEIMIHAKELKSVKALIDGKLVRQRTSSIYIPITIDSYNVMTQHQLVCHRFDIKLLRN